MKRNTAEILDSCIEEMRQGKSQDECLARYPDAARDLSPLLSAAAHVRSAPKITASEATMRAGKIVFLQEAGRLRAAQQKKQDKPWQRLSLVANLALPLPRPRLLTWSPVLSLLVVLALVFGTATTALAAGRSLPDEPLYPIKLATEQVQMALTLDPGARADLALSRTEKRLDEISALTSQGRTVAAPAIERLNSESSSALTTIARVDDEEDIRPWLRRYLGLVSQQQMVLSQVMPAPAIQSVVNAALTAAKENEKLAETAIVDPSTLRAAPPPSSRGVVVPADSPTPLPTPDPRRMRTPAPTASATSTAVPEPAATAQPTSTSTPSATAVPPTATPVPPTPTSAPTASATAVPLANFSGVIERVTQAEIVVGGTTVLLDRSTRIEGASALRVGQQVDVSAQPLGNERYLAVSITVHAPSVQPGAPVHLRGVILSMSGSSWNIGGQAVAIGPATVIHGSPAFGMIADVTGARRDDVIVATLVQIVGPAPQTQVQGPIERLTPNAWVVRGQSVSIVPGVTSVSGTAAIGKVAQVVALRLGSGELIALSITIQAAPVEEEFEGVISRIDGGVWLIGGRRVLRDASTSVDESLGRAQVGARARVRGVLQGDGAVLASSIRVLAAGGSSRPVSPTVPPTPSAAASPTSAPRESPTPPPSPQASPTNAPLEPSATPTMRVAPTRVRSTPVPTATPESSPTPEGPPPPPRR